jgi:hypothetical protein
VWRWANFLRAIGLEKQIPEGHSAAKPQAISDQLSPVRGPEHDRQYSGTEKDKAIGKTERTEVA